MGVPGAFYKQPQASRKLLADGQSALIIEADTARNGSINRNDSGGTVAAEMGELDGLKAHGDFLIYSWPENAFWLRESNRGWAATNSQRALIDLT